MREPALELMRRWASRALALIALGCQATPPIASQPPAKREPPWATATATYACRGWSPAMPAADRVTADLFTAGDSAAVAAIESAGGRIIHRWNIPALRVEIDPRRIAELAGSPQRPVHSALVVPPDAPLMASVIVILNDSLAKFDFAPLERLGMRVTSRWYAIGSFAASVPDSVIPALRSTKGFAVLGPAQIICDGSFPNDPITPGLR